MNLDSITEVKQFIIDRFSNKIQIVFHNREEKEYINFSSCNRKQIDVGVYDNHEIMLISFLHEYGHIQQFKQDIQLASIYLMEKDAWKKAFFELECCGFSKTDVMIKHAKWCVESYKEYAYPSFTPYDIKAIRIEENAFCPYCKYRKIQHIESKEINGDYGRVIISDYYCFDCHKLFKTINEKDLIKNSIDEDLNF